MNPMEKATRRLVATTGRLGGEQAEYIRGGRALGSIVATPARVSEEVLAEEAIETRARAVDWIVERESLALLDVAEPAAGDRLRVFRSGVPLVYEVAELGENVAEPADPYRVAWRIHSKLIAEG